MKDNNEIIIKLDSNIYNKQAILETSYKYTGRYYIKIDLVDKKYCLKFIPKNKKKESNTNFQNEFNNDLIDQQIRYRLSNELKTIRECIIKKAFSAIEENKPNVSK